jgi:apoptosis-inducing factor 3
MEGENFPKLRPVPLADKANQDNKPVIEKPQP